MLFLTICTVNYSTIVNKLAELIGQENKTEHQYAIWTLLHLTRQLEKGHNDTVTPATD